MNRFSCKIILFVCLLLSISPNIQAEDFSLLNFIPEILSKNLKPRLIIVNNCDDNAIMMFKVTGNDQWDFLKNQGADIIYSDYVKHAGDVYYRFTIPAKGSATTAPQKVLDIPEVGASSGTAYFGVACSPNADPTNPWYQCKLGGVPGTDLLSVATLFEPTFGCSNKIQDRSKCQTNRVNSKPLTAVDWFDISTVDGYTLPLKWEIAQATNCTKTMIDGSMFDLASCPSEGSATIDMTASDQSTYSQTLTTINNGFSLLTQDSENSYYKACVSPGKWVTTQTLGSPVNPTAIPLTADGLGVTPHTSDWYSTAMLCGIAASSTSCVCPACGGVQAYKGIDDNYTKSIPLTNFVTRLKEMGYKDGYSWPYDDAAGDMSCDQGGILTITLCPQGGKPYDKSRQWWYNATDQTCGVVDASTPSDAPKFASLFACQRDGIQKYSIVPEALTSANGLTATVKYCVTDKNGAYDTYAACKAQLQTLTDSSQ